MFACIHSTKAPPDALLACAEAFSPLVEQTAPDTVVLDSDGLERLYGSPHDIAAAIAHRAADAGLCASVALAMTPDTAVCAASGFGGISVVPQGDEAKFLGVLPLSLLAPSPEMAEILARWGIRRFRDLAALPENGIAERLGPEGVRLRKLARGEYTRPLRPVDDPLAFEEAMELDYEVDNLEPLLFLLSRLLQDVLERLMGRGLATNELRLTLNGHTRALRFPVPMTDARAFLKLLHLDLSARPPGAPITRIHLAAQPVKPRHTQNGLFLPLAPEPEKLEITLARVASLVGEENVGSPRIPDTHRPGAFTMERFHPEATTAPARPSAQLALRIFRPPRPARVRLASGHPQFITAGEIQGAIISHAGPWRTSGDWWTSDPWDRDEWDIELSDGALYLLICEPRGWFLQGNCD